MPLSPLNKQKVQLISILHHLRMEDNNWTEELYVFSFSRDCLKCVLLFHSCYSLCSYNVWFYMSWNTRGILWISVVQNMSGVAQSGPRHRHSGGLPEASTCRHYTSKELLKLLLKFFCSANIREVNNMAFHTWTS